MDGVDQVSLDRQSVGALRNLVEPGVYLRVDRVRAGVEVGVGVGVGVRVRVRVMVRVTVRVRHLPLDRLHDERRATWCLRSSLGSNGDRRRRKPRPEGDR